MKKEKAASRQLPKASRLRESAGPWLFSDPLGMFRVDTKTSEAWHNFGSR